MQENKFEKELGKNMEGFGIEPSANVWPEVERRIRKEKKRRFAFWFWFILLLLGAGLTTVILFNQGNKINNTIAIPHSAKNINNSFPTVIKKDSSTIKENTADVEKINEGVQSKSEEVINKIKFVPTKVDNIIATNSSPVKQKKSINKKRGIATGSTANKIDNQEEITLLQRNIKTVSKKQPETAADVGSEAKEKSIVNNPVNKSEAANIVEKEKLKNIIFLDADSNESGNTDSSFNLPNKEKENQKLKKWKRGLQFAAGKSGFSNSIFDINNARNDDLSYSSPGAGSGTVGAPLPSTVKPSLSLSAGWFIKKPISKKSDISLGINYHYLSTNRNIGSRVDSTREVNNNSPNKALVTEFYRLATVGNSNNYTNQFHFIGLQADIAWEIIASKKFTVYWENGIAYNRLVSSNFLHYSNALPGYYKYNSLLNKNQLTFSTGLLLPIGDKLMLKPFLNYNLTKVFKSYEKSNPHYSTYGLQLKYIFKK